jgi:hypothetical protein
LLRRQQQTLTSLDFKRRAEIIQGNHLPGRRTIAIGNAVDGIARLHED